jgi:hypothetical protein
MSRSKPTLASGSVSSRPPIAATRPLGRDRLSLADFLRLVVPTGSKRGIASARLAFPLLEQSEVASFRTELVHRLRRFFSQYANCLSVCVLCKGSGAGGKKFTESSPVKPSTDWV